MVLTKKEKNTSRCITVPKTSSKKKVVKNYDTGGVKNHDIGGIKRIYSPFNKFNVDRPKQIVKTMPKSPFIIPRNGLSPKERSFIICSCQSKTTRYIGLKTRALEAMKFKKIFTIYGKANTVRTALTKRGWVEKIPPNRMNLSKIRENKLNSKSEINEELERFLLSNMVERQAANFIWGTSGNINDLSKKHNVYAKETTNVSTPLMNKLVVETLWTTKQGLCNSLKESYWYYIEDVAEFDTPRTYSNTNDDEKADFIKDYKLTACTSLLKWTVSMVANNRPIFTDAGKISMNVMVFALNRCKEYLYEKQNRDIDREIYSTATAGQWNSFLKKYYILISNNDVFHTDVDQKLPLYIDYAKLLLREIHKYRPQLSCEGSHNIWIVKPTHCSRGRGIKLASKLNEITDMINRGCSKYVVQKYIEDPLLIHETKFDIRQYYLITSTCPLVIWMYRDCYLKFSSQKYNLGNFHESIHLTNNAVQKKYKNCNERHNDLPQHNMWDLDTYKKYLNKIGKELVWDHLTYPAMKKAIVGIMLTYQDSLSPSKNCFELYGCDFILDKDYRPWLIEINQGPDLNPTTQVTAKICPEVIEDIIKVVIDYACNPRASTGKFECLYRTPTLTPVRYGMNELEVIGVQLPLDYFYTGKIEVEGSSYTSHINDQRDINKMLRRLKSMYQSDIMKVPDCDEYWDNLDQETCNKKSHTDVVKKDHTEQVDELIVEKIPSDLSITSKRVSECQNSTSISSINLLKKCYKSKSAANSNSDLKKSPSKCTSAMACKVPFSFSKLDDGSDSKPSGYLLLPGTSNGTANGTPQGGTKYSKYKILNNEVKENINLVPNKKTVKEITKKIFDFLEMKENEYKFNT
ncbi:tubulin glycylase 3A-like isoform X2 [Hyposmocoma kahamanoa]|uniref:tubulin glycylase 3A-like isoform X2 n=1 Tax=Hyposmocoma kahamanoa TaxID=1477025 RepID=UPI000E6D7252|nr:tubulin glycylase 3A-like isoform X2 [Hyposmocoma kahamanoa]